MYVTYINPGEAREIIDLRGRKGLFWTLENGRYIGIDNRDGNAWTEEFDTREACEQWLRGGQMDRLTRLPCKTGDTVYEIMCPDCKDCAGCAPERYKSCHVRYGEFCGREEIRPIPFTLGCLDYMDKLVFLTREEAERAIKESGNNA